MSSDRHNELIEAIRQAWERLDASSLEPYLSKDFHYYSWWALVEFHSREEYLSYIQERFRTYRDTGYRPIVKIGINRNDGEHAVAIQYGEDVPILIRVIEKDGRIKEMWMQPAD